MENEMGAGLLSPWFLLIGPCLMNRPFLLVSVRTVSQERPCTSKSCCLSSPKPRAHQQHRAPTNLTGGWLCLPAFYRGPAEQEGRNHVRGEWVRRRLVSKFSISPSTPVTNQAFRPLCHVRFYKLSHQPFVPPKSRSYVPPSLSPAPFTDF